MTASILPYMSKQCKKSAIILKQNPRDHFYVVLPISGTHVHTILVEHSKTVIPLKLISKESYHSSYVTCHKTNLTFLDVAYWDAVAAISLKRSLFLTKCQKTGPTQKETKSRHKKAR